MKKEIWKFVDGYLKLYSVSNFGSVKRNDGYVLRGKSKVFVKGNLQKNGLLDYRGNIIQDALIELAKSKISDQQ